MNIYIPLLALFISYLPQSYWLTGVVVSVQDADTVTIKVNRLFTQANEVIRLVYIDAPELAQGSIANIGATVLSDKVLCRQVRVRIVGRGYYKRLLGEVFIDKKSMNLSLVQNGHAFLYPWSSFLSYRQKLEFIAARDNARKHKLGVWSVPLAKPWAFRRKQKSQTRKSKQLRLKARKS